MHDPHPTRRVALQSAAVALAGAFHARGAEPTATKSLAAVVTVYRPGSHSDVILGKILTGWKHDGGPGPALKLASLYVDQFPADDMARKMAKAHGVPIFDTIEKAVTVGGNRVAVDGVISIGEHGDYPVNDRGQKLHPRRRFFEAISDTFRKCGRVVPVFSDKHLGPLWADAKWMYDRAIEDKIPFMAGSSLPVTFRDPDVSIPMGAEIESAVGVGYDGLDIYGSHTLDCYQSFVERRRGGETGVEWVQSLRGEAMWKAVEEGVVAKETLAAALSVLPHHRDGDFRKDKESTLIRFRYADGFEGAVLMLPAFVDGILIGVKVKGQPKPVATRFEERPDPRYPHFAFLLKAVERMIHTGKPSYPVERTLLTSGILDRAITSLMQDGKRQATPELAIAYTPTDYPHAPNPRLESE